MYADCTISVKDILTEGVREGFGYRETLYIKMQCFYSFSSLFYLVARSEGEVVHAVVEDLGWTGAGFG